jgi:hypothetical protein
LSRILANEQPFLTNFEARIGYPVPTAGKLGFQEAAVIGTHPDRFPRQGWLLSNSLDLARISFNDRILAGNPALLGERIENVGAFYIHPEIKNNRN